MSHHVDTVMYANEMNQYPNLTIGCSMIFINIVRSRKRFSPWGKKQAVKDLDLVKNTMVIVMIKQITYGS